MARPVHVALATLTAALVVAAVWLLVQTRGRPTTADPTTGPVAVAPPADAADAAITRRPPPLLPPQAADAAIVAIAVADASAEQPGDASAPDASDPHAERVALTQNMAARSGHEHWVGKGEAVLDEVGHHALRVEDRGCYLSGCTATYWFLSRESYDATLRDEAASAVYAAWKGGKQWTTPEVQPDGQLVIALLLYRPD
jgi:hypothetical protein